MDLVQSTAGAIPVLNEKGEMTMKKVKVHRYITGKRPKYATRSDSESELEDDDFIEKQNQKESSPGYEDSVEIDDPRLRRLKVMNNYLNEDEEITQRRRIEEPEILESSSDDEGEKMDVSEDEKKDDYDDDEELSDGEIERRRQMLKQKVLVQKSEQQEVLEKEDDHLLSSGGSDGETSEYEEYTDSDEEQEARLKPVFIQKKDRITIIEKEREVAEQKREEQEKKKKAEERRRATLKMVEEEIRKEQASEQKTVEGSIGDVNTDDENNEVEFELWKLREMKRNKRDKEEKEQREKELMEIERIHNMTEEERKQELRNNPKVVTNKSTKGKYKFMQKYYHRGVYYLDKDDEIFKRNYASATLDDHYNKTVLPKVMQVKNFGRSGRTKYTHLVDQDTTQFDSPWSVETGQNSKFLSTHAAGLKEIYSRPSAKKHKQS